MQQTEFQTTGNLAARDGTRLFCRQFSAALRQRAELVIAHGLCEHSGRYTALAERIAQKGIYVVAHDHRGHGRSGGKPGCIRRFSDYIEGLRVVVGKCRREIGPQTPLLILGHSLGGLMALHYVQQNPEWLEVHIG